MLQHIVHKRGMLQLPLLCVHLLRSDVARQTSLAYMTRVLEDPLFTLQPVKDVIGLPYGSEITINDGFYVTIATYLLFRFILRNVVSTFVKKKNE